MKHRDAHRVAGRLEVGWEVIIDGQWETILTIITTIDDDSGEQWRTLLCTGDKVGRVRIDDKVMSRY